MVAESVPCWGETIKGAKTFRLHAKQARVVASKKRFTAFIAGTGSGKTAVGPVRMAAKILAHVNNPNVDIANEPYSGLVVAPTYKVLAKATVKEWLKFVQGTQLQGRYVESRNRYYLPNEWGELWFLSADNPDGLAGGQNHDLWFDEAGFAKYSAWTEAKARLGLHGGSALITTTPYSLNWLKYQFVDLADAGDPDYCYINACSIDNPAYNRDAYEEAKRTMSPQRFLMRYHGDFTKPAGLVYPDFDSCREQFDVAQLTGLLYGGCDWGFSIRPFACVVGVLDKNDVLWCWFARYRRDTMIQEHAKRIPFSTTYFVDPAEPEKAAALKQAGHTVYSPPIRDKALGFDLVNKRIYDGRLKILDDDCFGCMFGEANEYMFPTVEDELVNKEPVGRHDILDALRYMVVGIDARKMHETRGVRMAETAVY